MYPENTEGTQVIVSSMNLGYISDTARNRTHNLFRPTPTVSQLEHSVKWCILFIANDIDRCVNRVLYVRIYTMTIIEFRLFEKNPS